MTRVGSQRHSKKKIVANCWALFAEGEAIFAVFVLYIGLLT
jgi:hypothetical protein